MPSQTVSDASEAIRLESVAGPTRASAERAESCWPTAGSSGAVSLSRDCFPGDVARLRVPNGCLRSQGDGGLVPGKA